MPWEPQQYLKFQSERFAPFEDLVRLIQPRPEMRVVDLGCGTGELTARLAELLPGSHVTGIDSSAEMLERAKAHASANVRFEQGKLEELDGTWDLIFSHAAIQWVDGHEKLIPELIGHLAPGGQLAVQIPANHDHFTHVSIRELAQEEPFRSALGGWSRESPVLPVERYAEILYACGAEGIKARLEVYGHVLADAEAMAEWTKGTTMVPYLERLPERLRAVFLERYRALLRARFPQKPIFYAFKRILFAGAHP